MRSFGEKMINRKINDDVTSIVVKISELVVLWFDSVVVSMLSFQF